MVDRSLLDANIWSVSIDDMLVSVKGSTPYRVKMLATIRYDSMLKRSETLPNIEMDVEVLQVEISSSGNQKYFFLSNCLRSGTQWQSACSVYLGTLCRLRNILGAFILFVRTSRN